MFPQVLKRLRQARGITQAELARICDVSQQAVGRWEQGCNMPNNDTLNKIAIYFGVSLDDLAMEQSQKSPRSNYAVSWEGIKQNEQDRQNEIARAFLKLILKDKPEAQAYIDRATVTTNGRIILPDIDEVDQRYLDKMQRSLIEALHDATDNGNGTKTVNLKLPPK